MSFTIQYIPRAITSTLANCHSKVVILEGARAVGKTMLAQQELAAMGYRYYSLADPATYEYASRNITDWVNSLALPAIVDEAQRIPDLPLAIKERVDGFESNTRPLFILTGSASINRGGLDGQDPLTRRATRFSLCPLTEREIRRMPTNVIDDLWSGAPDISFESKESKEGLFSRISLGGFPAYVANSRLVGPRERSLSIRSDIDGVLGDNVQPGEHLDSAIAHSVLDRLLALPGDILNVSKLANETGINDRTAKRYISIFMRRFLIHPLPNLRLAANKQDFARSKIHPVDTSFSCEMLAKAGRDPQGDPILFGHLLESYVINQIVPSAQWSSRRPDTFFWRETSGRQAEVDLVLVSNNELIGIEVKSSDTVSTKDFAGLRRLSEDERFRRGYVIYTGGKFVRESENLWAVPIAALWNEGAFLRESESMTERVKREREAAELVRERPDSSADASIILSYNHDDNEYLDGAIVQLANSIVREYEYQFASTLRLFVDTQSIGLGEDWQRALDSAVESSTFIMPAVTPRYLGSSACRDELNKFVSRSEEKRNGHILSVIWQQFEGTLPAIQNPQATAIIQQYQYMNVSKLRDLDTNEKEYKATVRKLVDEIRKRIIQDREEMEDGVSDARESESQNFENGFLEKAESMAASSVSLRENLDKAGVEATLMGSIISKHPIPSNGDIKSLKAWSLIVEREAKGHANAMREHLTQVRHDWNEVTKATRGYIDLLGKLSDHEDGSGALHTLRTQLVSLRQSFNLPDNAQQVIPILEMMRMLTPRLGFLGDSYQEFINTFIDMKAATDDLLDQLDAIN